VRAARSRRRGAVVLAGLALAVVGGLGEPVLAPGRAPVAWAGSTCFGAPVTIIGSEGADAIKGTGGPDVIDGEGGDDVIDGGGGDDRICGGSGDDKIQGGAGTDKCDGGPGHDPAAGCESTTSIP
jgi:Ca2+-binding RTX toxin-like protein